MNELLPKPNAQQAALPQVVAEVRAPLTERLVALGTMAAGLAHGLRNPLNSASLQLTLAQRRLARVDGAQVQGARDAIELVDVELKRLSALVEDFLQCAEPQRPRLVQVDLRSTAEVVVTLLASVAAAAEVSVVLQQPSEPVRLELDDERIKHALLNLVRNAIEASSRGGTVYVRVEVVGDQGCVRVADSGPGLPAGAQVFDPFFSTKVHGTGLGLAIVHRVVVDHGGSVQVQSVPGSTVFRVALPMVRACSQPPPA